MLAVLHSWRIPRRETADGGSLPFLPGRRWPFDPQKERKGKGGKRRRRGKLSEKIRRRKEEGRTGKVEEGAKKGEGGKETIGGEETRRESREEEAHTRT